MNMETLQEQVKLLQNYIGGFAKLLKDIQSRVKSLEEKQQDPKDDKLMEIMESKKRDWPHLTCQFWSCEKNWIDKEIKGILRDRKKKVESKKEVDDEIKRLDSKIIKLKRENKKNKSREEVLKTGDKRKLTKSVDISMQDIVNIRKSADLHIQKKSVQTICQGIVMRKIVS